MSLHLPPPSPEARALSRPATPGDLPALIPMVQHWLDDLAWMTRGVTPGMIHARLERALDRARARVLCDADDQPLAFMVTGATGPGSAEIHALFSQGNGLGQQLLSEAKAEHDALSFVTPQMALQTQSFFRRAGFVPVGGPAPMRGYPTQGILMEWWRPR